MEKDRLKQFFRIFITYYVRVVTYFLLAYAILLQILQYYDRDEYCTWANENEFYHLEIDGGYCVVQWASLFLPMILFCYAYAFLVGPVHVGRILMKYLRN